VCEGRLDGWARPIPLYEMAVMIKPTEQLPVEQGLPETIGEAVELLLDLLSDWDDLPLLGEMDDTALECLP
jgi:hypothetical protein